MCSQFYDQNTNEFSVGQFYTTNAEYIIGNLVDDIPHNGTIIDPFAGQNDLLDFIGDQTGNPSFEAYDICPKHPQITGRDTLLDPPDYGDKWVVTNPPYLNRNKTEDKSVFNFYGVSDLYKAAIRSIMGCPGGLLVVPLNFLCDEKGTDVREEFLSSYSIIKLNIFEESVFNDTDYTVCSFSFFDGANNSQSVSAVFYPSGVTKEYRLKSEYGYRICGDFLDKVGSKSSKVEVSRFIKGEEPKGHVSHLFLRAIDTGSPDGRIRLQHNTKPRIAKKSDRTFAQLVSNIALTEAQENMVIQNFNSELEEARNRFRSLFLSQYRNSTKAYARKRISFTTAFRWIGNIIENVVRRGEK